MTNKKMDNSVRSFDWDASSAISVFAILLLIGLAFFSWLDYFNGKSSMPILYFAVIVVVYWAFLLVCMKLIENPPKYLPKIKKLLNKRIELWTNSIT